jgi:uncharacterized protein (TIGR03032 family)
MVIAREYLVNEPSLGMTNSAMREVRFEYSREFFRILAECGASLLVSTYQAGKLVVIGECQGQPALSFHNVDKAMGIAIHGQRIAVGGRSQIWFFESAPEIVGQGLGSESSGAEGTEFDACYLARTGYVTGDIQGHEMAWCGEELWIVNTSFSCLSTLEQPYSFVPRWRPRFISQLVPEDRCHLNGVCIADNRVRYVTAMSETDIAGGWRASKATSGCVIDVASGEIVYRGLAMPHSPRVHMGRLWLLDSGRGRLVTVDEGAGRVVTVTSQPGYTRGLDFHGSLAFIGLSRIRETSTFSGVPIAEKRELLKCGVAIVEITSGKHLAHFEFISGVEEIFDVRVLATARNPMLSGPLADADRNQTIWYIPTEDLAAEKFQRGLRCAERDAFEEAAENFSEALKINPQFTDSRWNLGVAQYFLGDIQASMVNLKTAIAQQPNQPAAHLNLAMGLFLQRRFVEAWAEYEWRWQCANFDKRAVPHVASIWNGEELSDKTILVYGEQGVGDEVMFASNYGALMKRSKRTIIGCQERLVPLFRRSFPGADCRSLEELQEGLASGMNDRPDYQIAAGSLPRYLRPELKVEDASSRFLQACAELRGVWQQKLSSLGDGLRVGISWRGGSQTNESLRRSIPTSDWRPILEIPGVHFINLQYGTTVDELAVICDLAGGRLNHWPESEGLVNLDAFAALVSCLDLVITIDNTTAHIGGALGVPTWVLLSFPSSSYWRWLDEGEQSVWYRSLRLFRKSRHESWSRLLGEVSKRLKGLVGDGR